MFKKAAVIGHPIAHSLSPKLHNFWLSKYSIAGKYEKIDVAIDKLEDFLLNLQVNGFSGINITIPHKENAYKILSEIAEISPIAQKIGAVNTVYFKDGKLAATNTDGYGFLQSLQQQINLDDLAKKRVLLIGAGGAARSIAASLTEKSVKSLTIANRTQARAVVLNEQLKLSAKIINFTDIDDYIADIDILINTTSLGMVGKAELLINLDKLPLNSVVADIIYKPRFTKLLTAAKQRGNKIVEGIDMLIYQAVPGFQLWFGQQPKIGDEERQLLLGIS